jgi:hypothetical protein
MSRIRKAIAAFILPFLGLPLADWIGGLEAWSWEMVAAAAVTGLISAIGVYTVPNAPPA